MSIWGTTGLPGQPFGERRIVFFKPLGRPGTAPGNHRVSEDALGPAKATLCRFWVPIQAPIDYRFAAQGATMPQFAGTQSYQKLEGVPGRARHTKCHFPDLQKWVWYGKS